MDVPIGCMVVVLDCRKEDLGLEADFELCNRLDGKVCET